MIIIDYVDYPYPKKHSACQPGLMVSMPYSVFLPFTTLYHLNTLVEIRGVVEKLLDLDYHHKQATNQLKYSA